MFPTASESAVRFEEVNGGDIARGIFLLLSTYRWPGIQVIFAVFSYGSGSKGRGEDEVTSIVKQSRPPRHC